MPHLIHNLCVIIVKSVEKTTESDGGSSCWSTRAPLTIACAKETVFDVSHIPSHSIQIYMHARRLFRCAVSIRVCTASTVANRSQIIHSLGCLNHIEIMN